MLNILLWLILAEWYAAFASVLSSTMSIALADMKCLVTVLAAPRAIE